MSPEPDGAESLFVRLDDETIVATVLSRGPWDPRALHGGPPAALLAEAIEAVPDDGTDWFVSRLTVELERPVPLEPLTVQAHVLRPGRKVSVIDASITHAATGTVLARARALRIRRADVPLPHHDGDLAPMLAIDAPPAGPEDGFEDVIKETGYIGFHNGAVEHRFLELPDAAGGEVFDWIRLIVPVLPDRPLTPLQRVAAAADFANGISHVLPFETHTFVNPDLTIHLFQPMAGEWVGMRSNTHHGTQGVGMSDTVLYDIGGRIGRANQSLLLDLREQRV
jgi:hypothetical protein